MTDGLRIAHLRIAPQWAILRWAILRIIYTNTAYIQHKYIHWWKYLNWICILVICIGYILPTIGKYLLVEFICNDLCNDFVNKNFSLLSNWLFRNNMYRSYLYLKRCLNVKETFWFKSLVAKQGCRSTGKSIICSLSVHQQLNHKWEARLHAIRSPLQRYLANNQPVDASCDSMISTAFIIKS